jgi:hypothetical protein
MEPKPWIESQALLEAYSRTGDLSALREHLDSGGSPNIYFGASSLLRLAVDAGHIEAVKRLLAHGADPNGIPRPDVPVSPMVQASRLGHVEIVRLLLDAGAEVNAREFQGDTAILAARRANQLEVAKVLLESGADPTIKNLAGNSALTTRPRRGKPDQVGELLLNTKYSAEVVSLQSHEVNRQLFKKAPKQIIEQVHEHDHRGDGDPFQIIRVMKTSGANYGITTGIKLRLEQVEPRELDRNK